MAEDDGENQKAAAATFRWRCVDAARWMMALAMTALIVTVTAYAVHVLSRPDELHLGVIGGFVSVEGSGTPAGKLTFVLGLEAGNPSGRVAIYYENVNAYLYGKSKNMSKAEYFVNIPVQDFSLKEQSTKFISIRAQPDLTGQEIPYQQLFSSGSGISDGVVAVNGTLTIGLYSWRNKTGKAATYYCSPVAVGGESPENKPAGGVTWCMDSLPTPQANLSAAP